MKKRLDKILVEKGVVPSRQRAVELIENPGVIIEGRKIFKPSAKAEENTEIKLLGEDIKWVSRAGLKLEKATEYWNIDCKGKTCIDIGASTGGFTEVLLSRGAGKIYALDVGHDQLSEKLRADEKVINIERVNARNIPENTIKERVDIIVIDVSYISLKIILPGTKRFLKEDGEIIALIKPQFETNKASKNSQGVVKNEKNYEQVIESIKSAADNLTLAHTNVIPSPVHGSKGNKEFLIHLRNKN